jgi:cell division septal protein FtsQ
VTRATPMRSGAHSAKGRSNLRGYDRDDTRRESPPSRRRNKRRRNRGPLIVVVIVLIAAAVVIPSMIFLNVHTVLVKGGVRYTADEIAEASGIRQGENLIALRVRAIESALYERFPYIETVAVKRKLPTAVEIHITEASSAFRVDAGEQVLIVSAKSKVLETPPAAALDQDNPDHAVPLVKGLSLQEGTLGKDLVYQDSVVRGALEDLLAALSDQGLLADITEIDIGRMHSIQALYQGRIILQFGNAENLDYKAQFAKYILEAEPIDERGTIDVSNTQRASFLPGDVGMTGDANPEQPKEPEPEQADAAG